MCLSDTRVCMRVEENSTIKLPPIQWVIHTIARAVYLVLLLVWSSKICWCFLYTWHTTTDTTDNARHIYTRIPTIYTLHIDWVYAMTNVFEYTYYTSSCWFVRSYMSVCTCLSMYLLIYSTIKHLHLLLFEFTIESMHGTLACCCYFSFLFFTLYVCCCCR